MPSIGVLRQIVEMGGLMSLGSDPRELISVVARLVGRILKGASPATQPIEQPIGYELIVNRRTADAIGCACRANCCFGQRGHRTVGAA